jgi:invasion protein IalB
MKTRPLPLLALLAALAAPLAAAAQETAPTPPAEGGEIQADAASADGLSMGIEVGSDKAKVGDTYIKAKFDAWEQRCIKTESGADPCQLYQLLKDSQGNSVAEFSLFTLPDGQTGPAVAGGNLIAPLETLLTEGLRLSIDGSKERAYPFTFCTNIGCIARLGFTAEEMAMFKKGAKATMTIVPFVAPDQKVVLDISLKGFTAGMDAVAADNKAADAAAKAAVPEPTPAP